MGCCAGFQKHDLKRHHHAIDRHPVVLRGRRRPDPPIRVTTTRGPNHHRRRHPSSILHSRPWVSALRAAGDGERWPVGRSLSSVVVPGPVFSAAAKLFVFFVVIWSPYQALYCRHPISAESPVASSLVDPQNRSNAKSFFTSPPACRQSPALPPKDRRRRRGRATPRRALSAKSGKAPSTFPDLLDTRTLSRVVLRQRAAPAIESPEQRTLLDIQQVTRLHQDTRFVAAGR